MRSDHSCVNLSLRPIDEFQKTGASFWKFNNSLLKNEKFTTGLKHYICNDINSECKEISSKQVRWEYTKFKIKTWSIKMSKNIAANRRKNEKELEKQIQFYEKKLGEEPTEQTYNSLDEAKAKLEIIQNYKTQSLMVQSRIQHYEEGEKSTNFFSKSNQTKQKRLSEN